MRDHAEALAAVRARDRRARYFNKARLVLLLGVLASIHAVAAWRSSRFLETNCTVEDGRVVKRRPGVWRPFVRVRVTGTTQTGLEWAELPGDPVRPSKTEADDQIAAYPSGTRLPCWVSTNSSPTHVLLTKPTVGFSGWIAGGLLMLAAGLLTRGATLGPSVDVGTNRGLGAYRDPPPSVSVGVGPPDVWTDARVDFVESPPSPWWMICLAALPSFLGGLVIWGGVSSGFQGQADGPGSLLVLGVIGLLLCLPLLGTLSVRGVRIHPDVLVVERWRRLGLTYWSRFESVAAMASVVVGRASTSAKADYCVVVRQAPRAIEVIRTPDEGRAQACAALLQQALEQRDLETGRTPEVPE